MDGFEIAARTLKSLGACLAAAASATVLWGLFTLVMALLGWPDGTTMGLRFGYWVQGQWPLVAFLFIAIMFVMVVFAMPVQAVLQMFGQAGYIATVMVAVVLGAGFYHWIFDTVEHLAHDPEIAPPSKLHPEWLAYGAAMGFYLGSVAWLIRRPDKDWQAPRRK